MKITINQKSAETFLICSGGKEYIIDSSKPTTEINLGDDGVVLISDTDTKEKLTAGRAVLYALYQIFMVIVRILFFIQPDWRDNIDPFKIKCRVEVSSDISELTFKYTSGGYCRKKEIFCEPELKCDNAGVTVTTEVKPDYNCVKKACIDSVVNLIITAAAAIAILSLLINFAAESVNPGVLILTWAVIALIAIAIIICVIYNRSKYCEFKEMLKKYE